MHRGFNYYYREGLKTSAKTIYRNKCFFRYILYFLVELLGRIAIIFNPHFNIANMRQGYVIRKANQLNFSSSFRSIGHRASIGTYILTLCFEGLILLAGIVATVILAAVLGGIGYGISKIASYENYRLLVLLFAAPAGLILVLYVLVNLLIFSPTAYIIVNNDGVSAGETIGACYRSMINNGKMTVFLTYFVSYLLKSLYMGAMGAGGYFLLTMFIPAKYFLITLIGWIVVSVAGYLLFAPILTLANRVVKEHLFEDVVLDPVVAARINEKVNLTICNGKKVASEAVSQNLASLFDYTEDPYKILEVTERKSERFDVDPSKPDKKKKFAKKDESKQKKEPVAKAAVKKAKAPKEKKVEDKPEPSPRHEVTASEAVAVEKNVQTVDEKPEVVEISAVDSQSSAQDINQPLN